MQNDASTHLYAHAPCTNAYCNHAPTGEVCRLLVNSFFRHVLNLRQAEVRQRLAQSQGQDPEAVILDKDACFRVEKRLFFFPRREEAPGGVVAGAGPDTETLRDDVWKRAERSAGERRTQRQRSSTAQQTCTSAA